jgi:hypothetical protein
VLGQVKLWWSFQVYQRPTIRPSKAFGNPRILQKHRARRRTASVCALLSNIFPLLFAFFAFLILLARYTQLYIFMPTLAKPPALVACFLPRSLSSSNDSRCTFPLYQALGVSSPLTLLHRFPGSIFSETACREACPDRFRFFLTIL